MKKLQRLTLKPLFIALISGSLCYAYAAPTTSNQATASKPAKSKVQPQRFKKYDASEVTTSSPNSVILNFENADIQSVIKAISKLSGKNFVIDPRVKGNVTIVSEKPISKAESYKVLEASLRMQGFATVEADGVIKVLPEADAKTYGMQTYVSASNSPGDQLVTKVFAIDNGSASAIATTIRPLIAPNNTITTYAGNNSIIVTDYASNMNRISKIIKQITESNKEQMKPRYVVLKNAVASDVAQTLQDALGLSGSSKSGGAPASGGSTGTDGPAGSVSVDANSNALIITANSVSKLNDIQELIKKLDTPNSNNMHVVYLKNADAYHVAEVLRIVASGEENPDLTATNSNREISDTSSSFSGGGSGGSSGGSSAAGVFGGGSKGGGSKSGGSSSAAPKSADANGKGPKVMIQAEPTTNSLIIQAPDNVYRNLRMVINMLDIRRAQIMVEALIVDVNNTVQGNFGVQWIAGAGGKGIGGIGGIGNYGEGGSSLSSIAAAALSISKGTPAAIPGEVLIGLFTGMTTVGGKQIPTIGALADAISSTGNLNILGRPTLLTLDNEEASIFVGTNVPIPNGSFVNSANANGGAVTTIVRQDLGTMLRVKPLVTQNGTVQMAIYQEDSKVDNTADAKQTAQYGATFLKRNINTKLVVNDGQIIALGGLVQDEIAMVQSGIPGLMDIPYLGWLFQFQTRKHVKRNLIIFLRPVVVRNQHDSDLLTNSRYEYITKEQNKITATGNIMLPSIKPVNMDNQVNWTETLPQNDTPVHGSSEELHNSAPTETNIAPTTGMNSTVNGVTITQPANNRVNIIANEPMN